MDKARLGVVGVGKWGNNIVRAISESNKLVLAGICDIDEKRAKSIASRFNTRWFTSIDEMIDKTHPDGVVVAVPATALAQTAASIVERGVNVLVEKPVATTSREAEYLKSLAKKHSVLVMPGFIMRFNPAILRLREIIDKYSDVIEIGVFRRLSRRPSWRRNIPIVYDLSIHDIDLARYLLGEIKKVENTFLGSKGGDEVLLTVLSLENGLQVIIHTDGVSLAKIREVDLEGRDVFIRTDTEKLMIRVKTLEDDHVINVDYYEPLKKELESFGARINGLEADLPTIDDAIAALKTVEKILERRGS